MGDRPLDQSPWDRNPPDTSRAALLLRGLLFGFAALVTSDAEEKVPTGGELTRFEAVGPSRA
jgi:hypothetical protein